MAPRGAAGCRRAGRLAWIDFHTGLGPAGVGERILAGRDDPATLVRAKAWWDSGGSTPVTSIYDGSSSSAFLTGLMWTAAYEECPQAEFTSIALEYGTVESKHFDAEYWRDPRLLELVAKVKVSVSDEANRRAFCGNVAPDLRQ